MFRLILPAAVLLGFASSVAAEGFNPAQHLAEKCSSCHSDDFYTRPDRRAKSLGQLKRIVRRCETNLGTGLFDDEIDTLANYLNDTYYKFQ